jgi:phosphocarrier protein HPr
MTTTFELTIVNRLGLHARAAAKFVHVASAFTSRVTVARNATRVDGKSILGLLTLAASKGTKLHLTIQGDDESEAGAQLSKLVHGRFGEDA